LIFLSRRTERLIFRIFGAALLAACLSCVTFPPAVAVEPLRILVSNDDGWNAPGITALVEALRGLGEVVVAAPARNHSGAGHSMTFDGPIAVQRNDKDGVPWFHYRRPPGHLRPPGRPVAPRDAARPGRERHQSPGQPGTETSYSGTLGCAEEAAVIGLPALAVSLERAEEMDYRAAAASRLSRPRARPARKPRTGPSP